MDEQESKLKMYSIGIVAETKPANSDMIKVVPMEVTPMVSGDIANQQKDYNTSAPNAKGVLQKDSVKGDQVIVAKWIPDGNETRVSAPDVVKGETVKIYRFADTDEYHWTTIFREPSLRRLEHIVNSVSNQSSGQTPYDLDSSYSTIISTRDQYIQITTAKNNGEACGYNIKLDTKAGTFVLEDTVGNFINLDSTAGVLTINVNSKFELTAPEVIINGVTTRNGDETTNGNTTISGNTDVGGKQTIQQGLAVAGGGSSLGGGARVEGSLEITENLDVGGNITAGGTVHGTNI